jgi:nitroimidazol reductase NimA-like FMN-containing flavoprotein (pyridoxamine 5'-phosphate oxidase superfamily)
MFGKLTGDEIEEVLTQQVVGRIGCHADGRTYIVPISYAYDGEFIIAHTAEGMKINIMRLNPEVCFEIDVMENMANWKSVITWGTFEEIKNSRDRKLAIQKLSDRVFPEMSSKTLQLSPEWPFPPNDPDKIKGIFFRIRLYEKTGRYEKSDAQTRNGL